MITCGGFPEAVYFDTHAPDESVHEVALKVPPVLPSFHDTVPKGVVGEPDESLTLTTNVIMPLLGKVAGFGLIVVVVRCSTFTERDDIPALPECAESPA